MNRIDSRLTQLKNENRAAFVAFITAGDPDLEASAALMAGLPGAGVDVIELGMPFTDPMADGPTIQAGNLRALKAGMNLKKTLQMVKNFRAKDKDTPVVLMGYYNPVYCFGVEKFMKEAAANGVDGLIVVDLPPEEDEEARLPAQAAGLHMIRLATPTTDVKRLPTVLKGSGGFLYYVSITGITGAAAADEKKVMEAVKRLKAATQLPVAVGFGIKDEAAAASVARQADGVVVGSAIVSSIASCLASGAKREELVRETLFLVKKLAAAVHGARGKAAA
jgi:tryptophan synthase alpha chain